MSNVTSYTRSSNISASTNNNNTGNNNAVVGSFPPDYKRPITGMFFCTYICCYICCCICWCVCF